MSWKSFRFFLHFFEWILIDWLMFFFVLFFRGLCEDNRPSLSLFYSAVELIWFPACTGVHFRHSHGGYYDWFPRLADALAGCSSVSDWTDSTINQSKCYSILGKTSHIFHCIVFFMNYIFQFWHFWKNFIYLFILKPSVLKICWQYKTYQSENNIIDFTI